MPVISRRLLIILFVCGLAGPVPAAEERFVEVPSADRVSIRSDEAWEGTEPDVIHFSGRFRLEAVDWFLAADHATLYGNLDDPETVRLRGKPATFRIRSGDDDHAQTIAGNAGQITYMRQLKVVRLEQDARLYWGDNVVRGEEIEYDLDADRIRAGGPGGVSLRFPPFD